MAIIIKKTVLLALVGLSFGLVVPDTQETAVSSGGSIVGSDGHIDDGQEWKPIVPTDSDSDAPNPHLEARRKLAPISKTRGPKGEGTVRV